jgi:hypothetical protein
LALCWTTTAFPQELEPRRWIPIPAGQNFIGVSYGHVDGEVFFSSALPVKDTTYKKQSVSLYYVRSLAIMGKNARLDFKLPYRANQYESIIEDEIVDQPKTGLGDAKVRISVLLYGASAHAPGEFTNGKRSNTVVGTGLTVTIPTGDYNDEHFFNLGVNRWVFRPQLGITHSRGRWTAELTGSVFYYTDNNDFWRDIVYETEPMYALQAHLIYTFRPGLWASLSTGYGWGANKTFNGINTNIKSETWPSALSLGVPIDRNQGLKFVFLRERTQRLTGVNSNSLIMAYTLRF